MKHQLIMSLVCAAVFSACSSQNQPQADAQPPSATQNFQKERTQGTKDRRQLSGGDVRITPEKPIKPSAPRVPGMRVSSVSVPTRTVALTFDDGPHATHTPRILNILAKYNAKATFFTLGSNVERYPSIARRIVSEGHEIASHSWDHPNLATSSRAAAASQLSRTNDVIMKATGRTPKLMRPPYGACNSSLIAWMKQDYGLTTVLWNVDTNDWRKPGVSAIISRAVNGAKPGAIILVHDIHASTADSVEGIVKGLQAKGYELVTVSELINRGYQYARQKKEEEAAQQQGNTVLPQPSPANGTATETIITETLTPVSPAPAPQTPVSPGAPSPVTVTTSSDSAD